VRMTRRTLPVRRLLVRALSGAETMNEKFPSRGVTVPTVLLSLMKYSAAPLASEKMLWTTGKAPGTSVGVNSR
jgi:hypothetical protein